MSCSVRIPVWSFPVSQYFRFDLTMNQNKRHEASILRTAYQRQDEVDSHGEVRHCCTGHWTFSTVWTVLILVTWHMWACLASSVTAWVHLYFFSAVNQKVEGCPHMAELNGRCVPLCKVSHFVQVLHYKGWQCYSVGTLQTLGFELIWVVYFCCYTR